MSEWFAASAPPPLSNVSSRSLRLRQCLDAALLEVRALKRALKQNPAHEAAVNADPAVTISTPTPISTSPLLIHSSCQTDMGMFNHASLHATSTPMSAASNLFSNTLYQDDDADDDIGDYQQQLSEPSSPDDAHQSPLVWRPFTHASPAPAAKERKGSIPLKEETDDDTAQTRMDQAATTPLPAFSFDGASKGQSRVTRDRVSSKRMTTPFASPAPLSPFMVSSAGIGGPEAESVMRGL
jgi:hypothetical protein